MATGEQAMALTDAYQRRIGTLQQRVGADAEAAWRRIVTQDLEPKALRKAWLEWTDQFFGRLLGAQAQAVATTDGYLARFLSMETGRPLAPVGLDPTAFTTDQMRGVAMRDVYARALRVTRQALNDGIPIDEALARGAARAAQMARTDVQLAARGASSYVLQSYGARGKVRWVRIPAYRRVLSGAENCALCTAAANQRYHIAQLMPIHPGCDCVVEPIVRNGLPEIERAIPAPQDSPGLVDAAAEEPASHVVTVVEHGELGPVLWHAGDNFTEM
jgi:hypothetical protein